MGPKYVAGHVLEEAQCDAEVLDLREFESGASSQEAGQKSIQGQGREAAIPGKDPGRDPGKAPATKCATDKSRRRPRRASRLRRSIPPAVRRMVLERDGRRCTCPGCNNRRFIHIHHIVPIWKGGTNAPENLTVTCGRCHSALHRGLLTVDGRAPHSLVWKNRYGNLNSS